MTMRPHAEQQRIDENYSGRQNWLHWGPYLSERQWGTVREDYSPNGDAWNFFTHRQATSRVYRWGEDGIAGISDENQYLCFAPAFWNGKDPILKERLFGLTNGEGNHGEDVKELYYYLDNTPVHSYMKYLYKYPQAAFPYDELVTVNRNRTKSDPEYELLDTGIFDRNGYFDISIEYAKAGTDDILVRITATNRSAEAATLHLLPTLWFRNTWKFGLTSGEVGMALQKDNCIKTVHPELPSYCFYFDPPDRVLFTENKNNKSLLWGATDKNPFRKDAFHKAVTGNEYDFLRGKEEGTKASPQFILQMGAGEEKVVRLRISKDEKPSPFDSDFTDCFEKRIAEADEFYSSLRIAGESAEHANIRRQAIAGMLWNKQYYYYDVDTWLKGDANLPVPPPERWKGRNAGWTSFKAADIISMPDKWEYPWFAAWDLAFHSMVIALSDPEFAKKQLLLLFGEGYSTPQGQLPAYEWNFSDVNPPVQALAALEICRISFSRTGKTDVDFLRTMYPLLLKNYNWWLSREDTNHNNVFEGGFLGLDNISVFDRSGALPEGGRLDQADGTAWMALFSLNMLEIALRLIETDSSYEDEAISFFDHFVLIANSLHQIAGLWSDSDTNDDGFFYDVLQLQDGRSIPVNMRSISGIIPLLAVKVLSVELLKTAPRFAEHLNDFERGSCRYQVVDKRAGDERVLLSLLNPLQLSALFPVLFSEQEMLAPGGIRSVSKVYENGFVLDVDGTDYGLRYMPGESDDGMYGGNSNWRGPVWMPLNYLVVRALKYYGAFYGNSLKFESPEREFTLSGAAEELSQRLMNMFLPGPGGGRPVNGPYDIYRTEHFEELILFYEYFHAETSHGIGASHQTGWTGLAALLTGT